MAEIALSTLKVLVVGLVLGAGLPLLFSVGIRLQDLGAGGEERDGSIVAPRPAAKYGAWAVFTVIAVVIVYVVLFVAKSSISHYLGIELPI